MAKKDRYAKETTPERVNLSAQPRLHQNAPEIQAYGTVSHMLPLDLEEPVRLEMTEQLNLLLADTMTLRDLYKKSHWQVAGPTFYQLHLLFDKHYGEQSEIVDTIAERIQLLGGVSIAMAADVAETTRIARPPRGREEVPVQISRLVDAHQIIIGHCRELAERADKLGDAGTNDLAVSDVLRTNELQVWFLSEHLVGRSTRTCGTAPVAYCWVIHSQTNRAGSPEPARHSIRASIPPPTFATSLSPAKQIDSISTARQIRSCNLPLNRFYRATTTTRHCRRPQLFPHPGTSIPASLTSSASGCSARPGNWSREPIN